MKTSKILSYDPTLSVEENASNNNVTTAAIRSYIQARGIDRSTDRQIFLFHKIKNYAGSHTDAKATEIASALGLSANTVRKYLKMDDPPKPKEKKTAILNQKERPQLIPISDNQNSILKAILAIHLPPRELSVRPYSLEVRIL